jgi:hypothetical protein
VALDRRIDMRVLLCAVALVACAKPSPPAPSAPSPVASAIAPAASASASVAVSSLAVEPPPPPEPPYELAADLEARKERMRKDVGKKTKFEVVNDVFLIAAPSGALGSSAVVSKKALAAYYNGRFDKKPQRAITILLFDSAPPYDAFCKIHWGEPCFTPFGFYNADLRTVVMNAGPGIGTLTHELVHPLVEADFPRAPDWLDEGIASLYEAFALPKDGEIRGQKNFRLPGLLAAMRSKTEREHARLTALFGMSDKEFRGPREGLNYALARYFCMWMESQKTLWKFYHAWRDDFAHDPTGEKAFASVMGKTPAGMDATWASWVRSL